MRPIPFFASAAAFVAVALPLIAPASAGQLNSAGTGQFAGSHASARGGSANALSLNNNFIDQSSRRPGKPQNLQSGAPTVSTALSTALSVGGDTTLQSNDKAGRTGPAYQLSSNPTVQVAVGAAVSLDGNASALASNHGAGSDIGGR